MASLAIMATHFQQDAFWDSNLFGVTEMEAMSFPSNIQNNQIDPSLLYGTSASTTNSTAPHTSRSTSVESSWPSQPWQSIESRSQDVNPPRPKMLLEPKPQPVRRQRKAPSGAALERRRQQNRAAQLAFRERSKKQMEEMRQEVAQCTEFNQKLFANVRELLERTEALKRDMEAVLSLQPPAVSSMEGAPPNASRTSSIELHTSPGSCSDEAYLDDDGNSV